MNRESSILYIFRGLDVKGTIYAIKNKITGKFYIGKTYKTIEERFSIHIKDSKKERNKHRKLYLAMNEHGIENFVIFKIGEYEEGELELKEIEFIHYYNSFYDGYNSTLGGDGRRYLTVSDEEVIECYEKVGSAKAVSDCLGICHQTALKILNSHNFNLELSRCKPVMIVETGEMFDSISKCADYFIEHKITTAKRRQTVVESISRVLRGERNSFLKYTFAFV